jgi:hypothetical protein
MATEAEMARVTPGRRWTLLVVASLVVGCLIASAPALAVRVVNANEAILISNDLSNHLTEVTSSADGSSTGDIIP